MRLLIGLAVLFTTAGCGVFLGERYVREQDRLVMRRPGMAEPWGVAYATATTGAFDPRALTAPLDVRVTATRLCRRYAENVFERSTVRGRSVAANGVVLDAAIFGAAVAGSLFVSETGGKAFALAAGAVPLGADAVVWRQTTVSAPVTVVTRAADPSGETDSGGVFACGVTAETAAAVFWSGRELAREAGGAYRLVLDEAELGAAATTAAVELELSLRPAGKSAVGLPIKAVLGRAYTAFAVTRDTVRRFPTPLRIARFAVAYPRSKAAADMRGYLLTMLPSMQDAAELREAAGVAGIDPELRRALHERFEELHVDEILRRLPVLLRSAVLAERDANTFLLNGYAADGRRLLAEKTAALGEACRLYREFHLRAGVAAALDEALARNLTETERRVADPWLLRCP